MASKITLTCDSCGKEVAQGQELLDRLLQLHAEHETARLRLVLLDAITEERDFLRRLVTRALTTGGTEEANEHRIA